MTLGMKPYKLPAVRGKPAVFLTSHTLCWVSSTYFTEQPVAYCTGTITYSHTGVIYLEGLFTCLVSLIM